MLMTTKTILRIIDTVHRLAGSYQNYHSSEEQTWIISHLSDPDLKTCAKSLSIIGLHLLSALENNELTGIKAARMMGVSRSGITKAAKRLLKYKLIVTSHHPANQKKIYYQLTQRGAKIAKVHDQMHQQLNSDIVDRLALNYSEDDLQAAANILQTLLKSKKRISQ